MVVAGEGAETADGGAGAAGAGIGVELEAVGAGVATVADGGARRVVEGAVEYGGVE